jgi:hypothetical protein
MKIKIKEDSTIHLKDKKMVLEAGEQYKIVSLSEIEKEEEKAKFKEMGLVYHDEGDAKKEELENMSFSEFGRSLHEQGVPSTSALGAKRRPIKLKQFIEAWDKYAQSYGFDGAKDVVFLSILGKKPRKKRLLDRKFFMLTPSIQSFPTTWTSSDTLHLQEVLQELFKLTIWSMHISTVVND